MEKKTQPTGPVYSLTHAQAMERWRQRLGLQPGQEPVSMIDKPATVSAAPKQDNRLSFEEATQRHREKLGMKPGETYVSMTDIQTMPNGKGGWRVGG